MIGNIARKSTHVQHHNFEKRRLLCISQKPTFALPYVRRIFYINTMGGIFVQKHNRLGALNGTTKGKPVIKCKMILGHGIRMTDLFLMITIR